MIITRIIVLGIGFILGIVSATVWHTDWPILTGIFWVLFTAGTAFSIWTVYQEKMSWHQLNPAYLLIPVFLAAFSLGNIRANSVLHANSPGQKFFNNLNNNTLIDIKGQVIAEPERRTEKRLDLRLRISQVKLANKEVWQNINPVDIRVMISTPRQKDLKKLVEKLSDSDAYGYQLLIEGIFKKTEKAKNPGGFDPEAFMLGEGYIATVKVFDWRQKKERKGFIQVLGKEKGNLFVEWALAAKRNFLATYKKCIPSPEARLISGATLGTRFALRGISYRDKLIEESFRHAGVGHVLAVSGLHVSVVSLLLYSFFRMTKISPKYFAPIVIFLLFCFTILTGARPSSMRASIMNAIIILTFVYINSNLVRATFAGLAISSFIILLRRPMALYSAGFLLSFGAVLSLVLLTTPIDRILKQLRGAVFISAILWYIGILFYACNNWVIFLRMESLIFCAIILIILIQLGASINKKFPKLLCFRFDRIPNILRLFLSAQFAIQLGMMIPMSSFFFGKFPIAGMFVNLAAIPLVGVLVQLGILVGIFGAIPVIGQTVALVIGATSYLVAKLFIFIAYLGTVIFPFPAVPKTNVTWIITYYSILVAFLSGCFWLPRLQSIIYKLRTKYPILVSRITPICFIIILGLIAGFRYSDNKTSQYTVDVLADSAIPVIAITSDNHKQGAVIFNTGNPFFAKTSLKNILLTRWVDHINLAFVSGHNPSFGMEGLVELGHDMEIDTILFPEFRGKNNVLPDFTDQPVAYYNTLNEKRLASSAAKGSKWALSNFDTYCEFFGLVKRKEIKADIYKSPCQMDISPNLKIEILTSVYRSYPVAFSFTINNKKWLVIADPSSKELQSLPAEKLNCDILVLGAPYRGNTKYYLKGIEILFTKIKTEKIIFCADNYAYGSAETIATETINLCEKLKNVQFIRTDQEGAVNEVVKLNE